MLPASSGSTLSERCCRLYFATILLISSVCFAQPQKDRPSELADASLEKLGTVQVYSASKHLQSLTEAPSFVTVVTGDDIRKFGYRTIADVLQSVAGMYIQYDRNYSYIG